ncbi:serine hydrolase domain-containing protein [Sporosarcina sp. FA9]|uniref:serine hydrolase domain-containing protein n=1 Tax=Sporosarcina sp. FA9 TaxID=3413030 RepID=UPI003F65A707
MDLFEEYAEKLVEENQIPGVGIGLNKDGKRFYEKGFGYRDVENKLEITADTIFGIASMTKSFTCVAIMKLQEAGKLSVHDKILNYLPEFQTADMEKTKEITIHHLMTHTAGIPPISTHVFARKRSIDSDPSAKDYLDLDLVNNIGSAIDTYEDMFNFIAELNYKPLDSAGSSFSYSNDSFGLLGVIISRVSGQSYESYVTEQILKPAKLTRSFFDLDKLDSFDDVTTLYAAKTTEEGVHVYPTEIWWDAPAMRAAGYLKSTMNDILRYLEIFRNGGMVGGVRILSKDSVNQMIYPHFEYEKGTYYGYGLRITPDYYGETLIEHGGGLKGVSSLMIVLPESGLTGVALSSLASVPSGRLLKGALNVHKGRQADASNFLLETEKIDEAELDKFVGSYTSGEGMNVKIDVNEGQLGHFTEGKYNPLRYVGSNSFVGIEKNKEDVIRFVTTETGSVDRIFYSSRQIRKDEK